MQWNHHINLDKKPDLTTPVKAVFKTGENTARQIEIMVEIYFLIASEMCMANHSVLEK